jgi:hypothetical protein
MKTKQKKGYALCFKVLIEVSYTTPANNTVLRYNIPTKSWTVLPDWNANVWATADQKDDLNDLYFGDSVNGNIYSINYTTYQFSGSAITSTIKTPWINKPEHEVAISKIEFKAKGNTASTLHSLIQKLWGRLLLLLQ